MKAGLLVNPRSGKHSGRGLSLVEKLKGRCGSRIAVLDQFHALPATLRELAGAGVDALFISSGDGTVQAIQTELAERNPFTALPDLALLPHGTTNLTANEIGFNERNLDRLASLFTSDSPPVPAIEERPTLRILNPGDGQVRHGMFLGAGAIPRAAALCQEQFNKRGIKGDWATFATLAAGIIGSFGRAGGKDEAGRIVRPYPMHATTEQGTLVSGDQLLLLATTLNRLILRSRPFWGGKTAPIRTTAIGYPPPSVARWLLPALYGGEARRMPPSCISRSAERIEIETRSPLLIDGEFFDPPAEGPLKVETGPVFRYLRA
ncbi:MAG: diacylglycerol kinase family protein [Parvibaculaceae bacterium]